MERTKKHYRIIIGNYRLGLFFNNNTVFIGNYLMDTIIFILLKIQVERVKVGENVIPANAGIFNVYKTLLIFTLDSGIPLRYSRNDIL
ncbi:MAG: hypothetical protein SVZ03_02935 [Spirochaetota bacterium]|nr:hypothetical protein [Spirochaetota bacterium]